MNFFNCFRLALNNILNKRLRSWLTLLGIVIGVAAVVAIVSISNGAQESMNARFNALGADIITVSLGGGRAMGMDMGRDGPGGASSSSARSSDEEDPVLTDRDVKVIKANTNISEVSRLVSERLDVVYGSETTSLTIKGIDPDTAESIFYLSIESGRLLQNSDLSSVVISYNIAYDTYKKPVTLGQRISINNKSYTVVGILTESSSRSEIYMNYKSAWDVTEDTNRNNYTSILAKQKDTTLNDETVEDIEKKLAISRNVYGKDHDFSITSALAMQERMSDMSSTLTLFLTGIAIISLIVGAIGVANSMFTSVLEKTKEIGILKSQGMTSYEVLLMFIFESGLFGLIGGLLGAILGILISLLFSTMSIRFFGGSDIATSISFSFIVLSITISTLIGIISGIIPASSASKIRPIEALRYE